MATDCSGVYLLLVALVVVETKIIADLVAWHFGSGEGETPLAYVRPMATELPWMDYVDKKLEFFKKEEEKGSWV